MNGWRGWLELHRRAHSIAECLRGFFDGGTVAGTEFKAGKIRGVGNGIRVAAVSHIKGDSPYTGNLDRPRAEQEGGHVTERDAGHAAVFHGGPGAHESGWGTMFTSVTSPVMGTRPLSNMAVTQPMVLCPHMACARPRR